MDIRVADRIPVLYELTKERTMKTMQSKADSQAMVAEFLAKGGKITKGKTQQPKKKRNEIQVVEIDVEALPLALRKLVGE